MEEKQKGCATLALWILLTLVGIYIFTLVTVGKIYREQTELVNTGTAIEATIERTTHAGIWEWGKIYARLEYTVDGQDYATDVPISMRTYQFPTGKVLDGKTLITAYYSEDDPAQIGFEGAVKTAKTARTISIVFLCISGVLSLFLMLGLIAMKLSD